MCMAKQVVRLPISVRDSNNLLYLHNIGFQASEEDSTNMDASMGKQVDRYPISEKASNYIDTIAGNGIFLIELFMFGLENNKEFKWRQNKVGIEFFLTCLMTCLTLCAFCSSFYRACRASATGFKGQDKACMIATVFTVSLCSIEYFRHLVPMPFFANDFFKSVAMVLAFGVFVASLVAYCFRCACEHSRTKLYD